MKLVDLTGRKFARLTVLRRESTKWNSPTWLCKCECGNTCVVDRSSLTRGISKSCGCQKHAAIVARNKAAAKHNMEGTRIYRKWNSMKNRCLNPNAQQFKNYGGRGIGVCERWLEFQNFYDDMGDPPPGTSLERANNNGDYCPENCQWATGKEQARNKRTNTLLTFRGETLCVAEWAERVSLPSGAIRQRLLKGWSVEKALTAPLRVAAKTVQR